MTDKVSIERIQKAHPAVREELEHKIYAEICEALKGRAMCRLAYTLRTWEEQDHLWQQGRTIPGVKVTDAKAGDSWHNYGLAVDVVLIIDGKVASYDFTKDFDDDGMSDWKEIDAIFKKYGWTGLYRKDGTRWDLPHFQKTFGLTIAEAKSRYLAKEFIEGTNYIKLNQ